MIQNNNAQINSIETFIISITDFESFKSIPDEPTSGLLRLENSQNTHRVTAHKEESSMTSRVFGWMFSAPKPKTIMTAPVKFSSNHHTQNEERSGSPPLSSSGDRFINKRKNSLHKTSIINLSPRSPRSPRMPNSPRENRTRDIALKLIRQATKNLKKELKLDKHDIKNPNHVIWEVITHVFTKLPNSAKKDLNKVFTDYSNHSIHSIKKSNTSRLYEKVRHLFVEFTFNQFVENLKITTILDNKKCYQHFFEFSASVYNEEIAEFALALRLYSKEDNKTLIHIDNITDMFEDINTSDELKNGVLNNIVNLQDENSGVTFENIFDNLEGDIHSTVNADGIERFKESKYCLVNLREDLGEEILKMSI